VLAVATPGLDFTGATSVRFGAAAATFTVGSARTITASVPAGSGTVAVTVTTPLGSSAKNSAGQFTYAA